MGILVSKSFLTNTPYSDGNTCALSEFSGGALHQDASFMGDDGNEVSVFLNRWKAAAVMASADWLPGTQTFAPKLVFFRFAWSTNNVLWKPKLSVNLYVKAATSNHVRGVLVEPTVLKLSSSTNNTYHIERKELVCRPTKNCIAGDLIILEVTALMTPPTDNDTSVLSFLYGGSAAHTDDPIGTVVTEYSSEFEFSNKVIPATFIPVNVVIEQKFKVKV